MKTLRFNKNIRILRSFFQSYLLISEIKLLQKHMVKFSRKSNFSGEGQKSSTTPSSMSLNQLTLVQQSFSINKVIHQKEFISFTQVRSSYGSTPMTLSRTRNFLESFTKKKWRKSKRTMKRNLSKSQVSKLSFNTLKEDTLETVTSSLRFKESVQSMLEEMHLLSETKTAVSLFSLSRK